MTLQASGAISLFDVNTELGRTNNTQLGLLCTNVRTLFGDASGAVAMFDGYGKSNTSVPGAPTGVSGTSTSCHSVSVSFSAPASNGGLSIDYYQAISSPGCFSATGTSPISVSGLSPSTSYTFRVRAHNSKGYGCYSSSSGSVTTCALQGSCAFTTGGCYCYYKVSGVSRYSAIAIGAGAGSNREVPGGSGAQSVRNYMNWSIPSPWAVYVACGGGVNYNNYAPQRNGVNVSTGIYGYRSAPNNCPGGAIVTAKNAGLAGYGAYYYGSSCTHTCYSRIQLSCNFASYCVGFYSASGSYGDYSTGGGAGTNNRPTAQNFYNNSNGYGGGSSSSGGTGCNTQYCHFHPSGGGGGSGIYAFVGDIHYGKASGYGGGIGSNGGTNGGCGSSSNSARGGNGGSYGGGGGAGYANYTTYYCCCGGSYVHYVSSSGFGGNGGSGAVRIVYPGDTRQFPKCNVGSP